jgi:superfamily II DNA or RNA helicase
MVLRDEPTIRPNLYRLPRDPVGERILVPAFRQATRVRGAFGWFSAGWIPRLAHGLAVFLARPQAESIDFTIAPALFPDEYDILQEAVARTQHVMARLQAIFKEASSPTADVLSRHAVSCLAWMVVHDRLTLRIAKVRPGANYHPKVWLFDDGIDVVAVRGSANATGRAYSRGIEHMDVDCTWDNRARVEAAAEMVDDWAHGRDDEIEEVLDLPAALIDTIVRLAPQSKPSEEEYEAAMTGSGRPRPASIPAIDDPQIFHIPSELQWREGRYGHQGQAVLAWESHGRRGVIAMATGAGKTITALIGAYRAWQEHQGPFLLVISAPSTPLLLQWRSECERFGLRAVLPTQAGGRAEKHIAIGNALLRIRTGATGHIEAIIVTNVLLSSPEFQNALKDLKNRVPDLRIMHIGDEAHSLGSPSFIREPPTFFDYRLALSATFERQYDDAGTVQLFRYFGPTVYEFGLDRAIGFCLVPYDYHVHIVDLDAAELEEFKDLSAKIARFIARSGGVADFGNETLTALLVARRAVVETAAAKLGALRIILTTHVGPVRHTLVYTSSKNPDQLLDAKKVIADLGLVVGQVTETETQDRALLERRLKGFADGDYDVLIAKRVLDEGVDIPQTREAILLASSSVEREWIQRRGRVLRPAQGKTFAILHDVVALPPPRESSLHDDSVLEFISSELDRVRAFGRHARNHVEVANRIRDVHLLYFEE